MFGSLSLKSSLSSVLRLGFVFALLALMLWPAHSQGSGYPGGYPNPNLQPDPTANVEATSTPTPTPTPCYSLAWDDGQTPVAAGAKYTPAHQAKFTLSITNADGSADSGASAPWVEVLSGGRGADDAITAWVKLDSAIANSQGKIHGTFTSGNRTETTTIGVLNVPHDKTSGTLASISIDQVWADTSSPDLWKFDPEFFYDESSPITFKMVYSRNGSATAIDSHNIKFVTTSMDAYVWDPNAGDDEDGDGLPDGDYVLRTFNQSDAQFHGDLVVWDPPVANSSSSSYTTNQTIKWDEDFMIDSVKFDGSDEDVTDENGK